MEKRKCIFKKCGVEFTPSKNKQVYCSTKCRTYAYRESLNGEKDGGGSSKDLPETKSDKYNKKNKTTVQVVKEAAKNMGATAVAIDDTEPKHPLWQKGDPKEGSMAFYSKYGVATYDELQNKKK